MRVEIAKAAEDQECFGHLWRDASGICPEVNCAVRSYCRSVWEEVSSLKENKKIGRGKYRGSNKYNRHGYVSLGRDVDVYVRLLTHLLGYPASLPKNWTRLNFNKKYSHLGNMLVAPTVNYHLFIYEGTTICRFWTNAVRVVLVDLSQELISQIKLVDPSREIIPIPASSVRKLAPCTGRTYCNSEADVEQLASWINQLYPQSRSGDHSNGES